MSAPAAFSSVSVASWRARGNTPSPLAEALSNASVGMRCRWFSVAATFGVAAVPLPAKLCRWFSVAAALGVAASSLPANRTRGSSSRTATVEVAPSPLPSNSSLPTSVSESVADPSNFACAVAPKSIASAAVSSSVADPDAADVPLPAACIANRMLSVERLSSNLPLAFETGSGTGCGPPPLSSVSVASALLDDIAA